MVLTGPITTPARSRSVPRLRSARSRQQRRLHHLLRDRAVRLLPRRARFTSRTRSARRRSSWRASSATSGRRRGSAIGSTSASASAASADRASRSTTRSCSSRRAGGGGRQERAGDVRLQGAAINPGARDFRAKVEALRADDIRQTYASCSRADLADRLICWHFPADSRKMYLIRKNHDLVLDTL